MCAKETFTKPLHHHHHHPELFTWGLLDWWIHTISMTRVSACCSRNHQHFCNWACTPLFLAKRSGTQCGLQLLYPSPPSGFDALCILKWFPALDLSTQQGISIPIPFVLYCTVLCKLYSRGVQFDPQRADVGGFSYEPHLINWLNVWLDPHQLLVGETGHHWSTDCSQKIIYTILTLNHLAPPTMPSPIMMFPSTVSIN